MLLVGEDGPPSLAKGASLVFIDQEDGVALIVRVGSVIEFVVAAIERVVFTVEVFAVDIGKDALGAAGAVDARL